MPALSEREGVFRAAADERDVAVGKHEVRAAGMPAGKVVEAANKTQIQLPVVLRLEGTNVEQGREILQQSGLNFIVAETMKDAAEKVVAAASRA